ncbi:Nif3-like dinuclear metal center hexameric protein [Clostridium estertheticum]|uniref:Nif3-like dinuclear metal center hexameric protein n=1 Tax=Clostridium estertheticum TaxID=238834 RepID=UPI001C0C6801|nr:Nif3-like dinuclear metal center hexameric protein [Clostridium estertheticum]MBU3073040.1 Nif3-like dinuclear metal center hexameric protein [Clostridium estertheticum]MBU3162923.1 Nif3-like dinuclear metal center hexameric protein [Clostridium estertheticum]
MLLKVKDIENIMEEYAPSILKESYDNVGLMVGERAENVTKILVALDCTMDVIREAKNKGCNFILTHHPLLFVKPKTITTDTLVGRKVIELIKNGINVYSSHTNLDSVKGGLNDIVTEILGFSKYKIIEMSETNDSGKTDAGKTDAGIGRLVILDEPIRFESLCENVKRTLKAEFIRVVGKDDRLVNTIAIINGSGEDFFGESIKLGADCIITGDTKYHGACDLLEQNIALIDAGHFKTEWIPFKIFVEKFKKRLIEDGYDNEVIISKCTFDPYKIK